MLMVGASIQEVELIVYYLYQHEELFNYFIETYPLWIAKVRKALSLLKEAPPDDQSLTDKSAEEAQFGWLNNRLVYAQQKLYCPFLRDGACSIYEVRPFYCAGYIATHPGELCNPLHPDYSKNRERVYQTFQRSLFQDMSFYGEGLKKPVWSFMPIWFMTH